MITDYDVFSLRNNILATLYRRLYEVLFQGKVANTSSWGICVSSRGEIIKLSLITTFYLYSYRSESQLDVSVVAML